ncbi:MAG: hypothetical protein KAY24_06545 [Candidatus Eisenbacteria sp.]|nr:hypothetical protein [Candidatus Eisenbacteria bacterium]
MNKDVLATLRLPRSRAAPRVEVFLLTAVIALVGFLLSPTAIQAEAWPAWPQSRAGHASILPSDDLSILASNIEAGSSRGSGRQVSSSASDRDGALTPAEAATRPGGLSGFWRSIGETSIGRRVISVSQWVIGSARLLWAIPKAIIKGDSRSLIEAIGDLISKATTSEETDRESRERRQRMP